jgi:uncharacterized membrane protein (UPF0136 family)
MTFHDYTLAFGIISIVFGLLGFVRAKSKASLIAGSISGLLLILGWYLAGHGQATAGFWLSLVVTFLLLGKFLPTALKRKQIYPAGIMAGLALVGLVLGLKTLF